MSEKMSFIEKLEAFFSGKGFYIVLFVCVAVIGVSAYLLFTESRENVEEALEANSGYEDYAEPFNEDPEMVLPPDLDEEPAMAENETQDEDALEAATDSEETGNWTEQQAETAVSAQYIWPLEGEITAPYSVTALIYSEKMGDWRTHDGVDIAAPLGTQVLAACAGQVEKVYTDDMGGTTVIIEHAGGIRSIYANLASMPTVYEGDSVMTGEIIGAVGATAPGETKENPHLLFKMTMDGQSIDPSDYLPPR